MDMPVNESAADRAVRIHAGILLLTAAAPDLAFRTVQTVLTTAGTLAFLTGAVGWCPAYTVFGFSTGTSTRRAGCAWCETESRKER